MTTTYMAGLDGSDASTRAARYAAEQAQANNAKLLLVHVIEWSGFDVMGPEELPQRHLIREEELTYAQTHILDPMVKELKATGVSAETYLHHGHASRTLLSLVEEQNVSHIFIGRHGASRLEVLILGSTANSLVQAAPVPVTVVP